jgi:hypothetical protein
MESIQIHGTQSAGLTLVRRTFFPNSAGRAAMSTDCNRTTAEKKLLLKDIQWLSGVIVNCPTLLSVVADKRRLLLPRRSHDNAPAFTTVWRVSGE